MTDQPNRLSTPPQPKTMRLDERLRIARENFERKFKEYHKLLKSKIVPENQTQAKKKFEKHTIDELVKACLKIEDLNYGEGLVGMCVVALREHLMVRNRVNTLEYKLEESLKQIKQLKRELGVEE